jgi:hypothetical protein
MALVKCPRCELNYILDGGDLCTVCRKEVHGGSEQDDIAELCSECGENPAVPGGELCLSCLKEMARRLSPSATEDDLIPDEAALEIDSVSTMDEIAIDIDDEEMPADAFADDEDDEDKEEEEEADDEFAPVDPLDDEEISLDALADADDEEDDDLRDR